jgi:transcriptional regulator with XRE-family HTH domain
MMSANTIPDSPFDKLVASPVHPVDTLPPHPGLAKEELQHQLVKLRKAAGLTQHALHEDSGWSVSKIIRLETGSGHIIPGDVRAMLSTYGIQDETLILKLTEQARDVEEARESGEDHLFSPAGMSFLKHEAEASKIRIYESELLPDAMQPRKYALALARVLKPGIDPERIKDLDKFRRDRAAYLLGKYGPRLHVILDETVLRRAIGGEGLSSSDPKKFSVIELAINGLRSLHSTGNSNDTAGSENGQFNPHVTIQVIPYRRGLHPSMRHPFTILDPSDDDESIVYVNGNFRGQGNDGPLNSHTAPHIKAFNELTQHALGPEQTADILEWILDGNASRIERTITS